MADRDTSVVAQGVIYKPSSTIRLFLEVESRRSWTVCPP